MLVLHVICRNKFSFNVCGDSVCSHGHCEDRTDQILSLKQHKILDM